MFGKTVGDQRAFHVRRVHRAVHNDGLPVQDTVCAVVPQTFAGARIQRKETCERRYEHETIRYCHRSEYRGVEGMSPELLTGGGKGVDVPEIKSANVDDTGSNIECCAVKRGRRQRAATGLRNFSVDRQLRGPRHGHVAAPEAVQIAIFAGGGNERCSIRILKQSRGRAPFDVPIGIIEWKEVVASDIQCIRVKGHECTAPESALWILVAGAAGCIHGIRYSIKCRRRPDATADIILRGQIFDSRFERVVEINANQGAPHKRAIA